MRQIEIIGMNEFLISTAEIPKPNFDEVLLKVKAIGLNRADILQSEGLYPSPNISNVPGLEVSGDIEGNAVSVCALVASGGFSEYVLVKKRHIMPIPKNLDVIQAAALPEALITCWLNLFELGGIENAESVLIHGGSSGIGTFAIQIAKALNKKVYSSVGSDDKIEKCKELGADGVFNYHKDYVQMIKGNGGVDIILDILGGEYFSKNLSCLNQSGKLILITIMDGSNSIANLAAILMKNLQIFGSTLRSKPTDEKAMLVDSVIKNLYPYIENGKIVPQIDSIYKFEDFEQALNRMRSRKHFGKIIITT